VESRPSRSPGIVECPHAERCSGCSLIASPYPEQLIYKRRALENALRRYPELAGLEVADTVGADALTDYRTRAKLVVAGQSLGLFARASHDVIDIPECRILGPHTARAVRAIRGSLPFAFPLSAVDVREVDAGALVTLIVSPSAEEASLAAAVAELRAREPSILGVAVARKDDASPRVLGSAPVWRSGVKSAPHRLAPNEPYHDATFGSFVQAHAGQASQLYGAVARQIEQALGGLEGRPVLELYAGAGALALRLANAGARVTAVDSFEPSMRALERAARAQGLTLECRALTAERALERAAHDDAARDHAAHDAPPRAVVLDPPRRGLSPAVRRALAELAPELVVYVSCGPATLARDLAHLAWLGLGATSAVPYDMIPLSDSVEALVTLAPALAPAPRILAETELVLAVDKPPHLAPEELTARVRKLDAGAHAHAVPVSLAAPDASGVSVYARERAAFATVQAAFQGGTREELALIRGIVRAKGSIQRPLSRSRASARAGNAPVSRTQYRRERVVGTHSFVRAKLEPAGMSAERVRRHFAAIGHPVLGDERHGHAPSNRHFLEAHGLDRAFLHTARIVLALPSGPLTIDAPITADLESVLVSLTA
jgi:23S rRNA (uracil1939-C5)-methyltransferase